MCVYVKTTHKNFTTHENFTTHKNFTKNKNLKLYTQKFKGLISNKPKKS